MSDAGFVVRCTPPARGLRVTRDVGQRLLNDAVDGALGLGVQTAVVSLVQELDGDLMPAAEIGDERLQRGDESEIVKRRRMQEM